MQQETISGNEGKTIKASFQQRSAGISLVITGTVALYYIARAWPMRPIALAGAAIPAGFGSLVLTTFALIIVAEIVLQIVLVIGAGAASKPTSHDQMAALKANRNAYGVLAAGSLGVVGLLFAGLPAFCLANLAVLALLLAEITKFASQLFFGRRHA